MVTESSEYRCEQCSSQQPADHTWVHRRQSD